MKPRGVTTPMEALDEYILMVLFILVLSSFPIMLIIDVSKHS